MHDYLINQENIDSDYLAELLEMPKDKVAGFYGPGIIGSIETHIDDISAYPIEDYTECIVGEYCAVFSTLTPYLSRYELELIGDKVPAELIAAVERIGDKEYLHESKALARYARLYGYKLGVHNSVGYSQSDWHTVITLSPINAGEDQHVSLDTFDALMWGDVYRLYMELISPNGKTFTDIIGGYIGNDSLPYGHSDMANELHNQIMKEWKNG